MKEITEITTAMLSILIPVRALGSGIRRNRLFAGIATLLLMASAASAQKPMEAIAVKPLHDFSTPANWQKPIIIKSHEEAAKHFSKEALTTVETSIDWKKQFVLVFVWNGSGGDELQHQILESFPEKISFSMNRGMTRDLKQHTQVYALRSNVTWSVQNN